MVHYLDTIKYPLYYITSHRHINTLIHERNSMVINIHVYRQPETCELDATSRRLASIILSALLCDVALVLIFLVKVFMLCLYTRNLVSIATPTRETTSNHR
jgi:hypothetical protein